MKHFLLFFFLIITNFCFGQNTKIASIILTQPIATKHIQRDSFNLSKFFMKSYFAQKLIIDTNGIATLRHSNITQVDLVYSQYKSVESFNQQELNKQRLEELNKYFPEVFENYKIKW